MALSARAGPVGWWGTLSPRGRRAALVPAWLVLTLGFWAAASAATTPVLLPGPLPAARAGIELLATGALLQDTAVTLVRLAMGFALGCLVAIPLGLLMGQFRIVRRLLEPYVQSIRFVTSMALLGLVVVLFGLSDMGKVFLVFYGTVFVVLINTMIGVLRVPLVTIRSAQSLGANPGQIFVRVTLPATVPYVVTGMRMALGNAYMSVVAAEMLFANSGLGYLIAGSRVFFRTDEMLVGILAVGTLGLLSDLLLRLAAGRFGEKYGVRF